VDELHFRLENKAFEKVNLLWLKSLNQCIQSDRCTQEELKYEKMLQASLKNRYIKNKEKGILNIIVSEYQYNVKKSIDLAAKYTANAIQTSPGNVQYRIRYAQLLLLDQQYDNALSALEQARTRDNNNLHSENIDALYNLILRKKR